MVTKRTTYFKSIDFVLIHRSITLPWNTPPRVSIKAPPVHVKCSFYWLSQPLESQKYFTASEAKRAAHTRPPPLPQQTAEKCRNVTNGSGISLFEEESYFSHGTGRVHQERNSGQSVKQHRLNSYAGILFASARANLGNKCFSSQQTHSAHRAREAVAVVYNIKVGSLLNLPSANDILAHVLFSGAE